MITLRVRYSYVQSLTSLVSPEITRHDHSIIACSRHIYVWCCSSRTSRSWWITHSTQHHRRGCNNIPSFLQRTAPIARSLGEGWTPHDLHILVTAPFCCDRKSRAAYAQSFALWKQATIEFTRHDHSIIACSHHIYEWCCSSRTSRSWWITHSTQHHQRGCNTALHVDWTVSSKPTLSDDADPKSSVASTFIEVHRSDNVFVLPFHATTHVNDEIMWYTSF